MFLKHQKKERQPPVATEILYITKKNIYRFTRNKLLKVRLFIKP